MVALLQFDFYCLKLWNAYNVWLPLKLRLFVLLVAEHRLEPLLSAVFINVFTLKLVD